MALPVWALTGGDLNQAARWAPLVALPLTALGLAVVLADRDRGQAATEVVDAQRRPWTAPSLDRMVERPELGDRLVAALMAPVPGEVGLTTGLAGAGGFGKTRLATWACRRPEIERRYPGGLLWTTVGQEVRGADLAERVNDLAFVLCGRRPAISDPDTAGAELGRLLDERQSLLLVVDDVWEETQLRPFRYGGRSSTRLITTRVPDLLPAGGARIRVDAMPSDQARQLVADGVVGLPAGAADRLADLAGRWPVLLNLINGVLRRRVARGQPPRCAAAEIVDTLLAEGPVAFDPARPADRSRAVAAPSRQAWSCSIRPTGSATSTWRYYLQTRRNPSERAIVHGSLIDAAGALLPAHHEHASAPWWLLPADAGYLWRYAPHHLHQASRVDELTSLTCDLRWVEAKTQRFGSVVTAEADLELVNMPTATALRRVLRQIAPLLGPIEPPAALGATLANRLHDMPELQATLDRYRATLSRPRLEPAWPLPDQPDLAQPPRSGHTGGVTSCAFSPDGTFLATASDREGQPRRSISADAVPAAVPQNTTRRPVESRSGKITPAGYPARAGVE